jgi:hypothetical protein
LYESCSASGTDGRQEWTSPARSEVSGAAPFEYSVALATGLREVRLFLRPGTREGPATARASWDRGWTTLRSLQRRGLVDLTRGETVGALFTPHSAEAAFGLCLGVAIRPHADPLFKAYFDPMAAGIRHSHALVGEAVSRLGFGAGWTWLNRHVLTTSENPMRFVALDLSAADDARVKIYTVMQERDITSVESLLGAVPGYVPGTASAFHGSLLGPDTPFDPGRTRPLMCWSMTSRARSHPREVTLYLPLNRYVDDDDTALRRIAGTVPETEATALGRAVHLAARRDPRVTHRPMHWVGTKLTTSEPNVTVYLSAESLHPPASAEHESGQ